MLDNDPNKRPTAEEILGHPLFWSSHQRQEYFKKLLHLREKLPNFDNEFSVLVQNFKIIPESGWYSKIESSLIFDLQNQYNTNSVWDLIRAITNCGKFYIEINHPNKDVNLQHFLNGKLEPVDYFCHLFPRLLIESWIFIRNKRKQLQKNLSFLEQAEFPCVSKF